MKINGKNLLVTVPREIQILDFRATTVGMKCVKHEDSGARDLAVGHHQVQGAKTELSVFCHRGTGAQRWGGTADRIHTRDKIIYCGLASSWAHYICDSNHFFKKISNEFKSNRFKAIFKKIYMWRGDRKKNSGARSQNSEWSGDELSRIKLNQGYYGFSHGLTRMKHGLEGGETFNAEHSRFREMRIKIKIISQSDGCAVKVRAGRAFGGSASPVLLVYLTKPLGLMRFHIKFEAIRWFSMISGNLKNNFFSESPCVGQSAVGPPAYGVDSERIKVN